MPGDWRDKARERAKQKAQGTKFKLEPGDNSFRVLPNAKGLDHPPYYEYLIHRDVGPDKKMVRCGKSVDSREGECWLCDEVTPRLDKSGKRSKMALARSLAPKEQFVVQVASVSESGKMRGPLTWYVPTGGAKSMSVQVLGTLASPRRRYDDPKKGYNLNVNRQGTGKMDTRYGAIEPDDEPTKVPSSILNALKPFDKVLQPYDEDEQRAAFYGRSVEEMKSSHDDDDEDEGGRMATKKKTKKLSASEERELKKKKGRKAEDEDEEEEEVEEDEEEVDDDEEDEDDEPKKKKGTSGSNQSFECFEILLAD